MIGSGSSSRRRRKARRPWSGCCETRERWRCAMQRHSRLVLVTGLALIAAGCDWYYNDVPSPDDLWHITPWFDHMIVQKSVPPYSRADIPRYTPEGTVPISGGEPDWGAEFASGKTATADALKNPTTGGESALAARHGAATAEIPGSVDAKGDTLFQNFCSPCHGPAGAGDGPCLLYTSPSP